MQKMCLFLLFLIFPCGLVATPNAEGEAHFRVGPFFEWRSEGGTTSRVALRPFFAWEDDPRDASNDVNLDVLWPVSHSSWRGSSFQSRFLIALWHEKNGVGEEADDYFFTLPPVWTQGRQRGENYMACFPVAGTLPKCFMLEDVRWVLFPLWFHFRTGGARSTPRDYIVWPFFSLKYDDDETRWGLWPLYGTKWEPGVHSRYVLWPFWNDATYDSETTQGSAFMLWPLMESVSTNRETTFGVLPPFFRTTTLTNGTLNVRCPWPLFEHYSDRNESTWRSWRFWGVTQRGSRGAWWVLYPILRHTDQETASQYISNTQFWPFYTNDYVYEYDNDGKETLTSSYFRLWPFYSSKYHVDEGLRQRSLELLPMRDAAPVERNLTPFWTFYQATHQPGDKEVLHELFWGLIWWYTTVDEESVE
ncbi:MAG: hypothetical protein Q4F99_03415 [bacterium]|nr:hypothetical protein [bacterium]